jgi:hypothetical protein
MSAEEELRSVMGGLVSGTGPRHMIAPSIPAGGPATPEEKIAALERDVRSLYDGLLIAGRQIDGLRRMLGAKT